MWAASRFFLGLRIRLLRKCWRDEILGGGERGTAKGRKSKKSPERELEQSSRKSLPANGQVTSEGI